MKKLLYITAVFSVLLLSVSYLGNITLGKKPKLKEKELSRHLRNVNLNNYPKLKKEYEEINFKNKNIDISKIKNLKNRIKQAYEAERLDGKNGRSLAFYYLDLLLKLKSLNPKDSKTILELGDISFERRVFGKAKEYYLDYLDLANTDSEVRARLASAYTFLGEFDKAISELDEILIKQPKHFQALAYKAIALSQKKEFEKAILVGEKALENAPTDEAFTRFGSYLEKLKASSNSDPLEDYFRNNNVTKNKFLKIEKDEDKIKVYLKDFPFENMPVFAKEKFKKSIKSNLVNKKQVVIIDTTSKKEMTLFND